MSIDNLAEQDIALFRTTYPVLNNVTIETSPLPKYDRAAAQRLWDGETPAPQKATEPAKPPAQVAAK